MFMNVAYLNNSTSTVVDNTKPLIVTSCGNYHVKNRSEVVTICVNNLNHFSYSAMTVK